MNPFLLHPEPPPPELAQALDLGGWSWKAVSDITGTIASEPDRGWAGAIIVADLNPERALGFCRDLRNKETPLEPILLLINTNHLDKLMAHWDLFDDFCLIPLQPIELTTRLQHLLAKSAKGSRQNLIQYGPLALNIETYQAALAGQPIDLTYMEYELLRFLAGHPGKVFTREILLSRVWGYDYYGGARTVDVHIRRLRAKLGEEHANLIHTVRSVGYRFGQSRWKI